MGGVSGLVYASIPTLAYVIVNAIAGLNAAVVVAVGASAGLIAAEDASQGAASAGSVRVARRRRRGGDRVLHRIRRGLLPAWNLVQLGRGRRVHRVPRGAATAGRGDLESDAQCRAGSGWRADKVVLRAIRLSRRSTFAAVFAARFLVQDSLYDAGSTGWLAFARIAMGYPLLALALLVVVLGGAPRQSAARRQR